MSSGQAPDKRRYKVEAIPGLPPQGGKCQGPAYDPDWWTGREILTGDQYRTVYPHASLARSICKTCQMMQRCQLFAVEHRETGIWGAVKYVGGEVGDRAIGGQDAIVAAA